MVGEITDVDVMVRTKNCRPNESTLMKLSVLAVVWNSVDPNLPMEGIKLHQLRAFYKKHLNLRFHDFRKRRAVALKKASLSVASEASRMNWKSPGMLEHYAKLR